MIISCWILNTTVPCIGYVQYHLTVDRCCLLVNNSLAEKEKVKEEKTVELRTKKNELKEANRLVEDKKKRVAQYEKDKKEKENSLEWEKEQQDLYRKAK